ncbi:alkaline serine protease [Ahniella affigens]|uniref:Alkaline serine protease n=1 Tax=Ahniella affigens TaxID=2021234 RepID=A0A2P1PYA9_9GAMM|nr:S8 family serine peptidase [Ahniella affigens]AVP99828.1 alkaline serine protease [Ahniella affigens]
MKRRTLLKQTLAASAVTMAFATSAMAAAELRYAQRPVQGQYIVVLKDQVASLSVERNSAKPSIASVANSIAAAHKAQVFRTFNAALRGFVIKADDKALVSMLNDDRIAYIEEDGYVYANATQTGATWGIDRTDQRDLPLNSSYTYNTTASNVHAYIIDTGVLGTHTQFTGRMGNGFTAISDANGTNDCNGHGTHVAGTVGGTTYGIAKGVTVHPVRVLGCDGSGTNSGVIGGVDWVRTNHVKPAVANMSLGGGASQALDDAITAVSNAGVIVVVAAGNDNANACNYSPARAAAAITVGSTTNTDARSSFSNFGTCLDIFAPGSNILSSWYTGTSATNTISGTSMASPHVAGVVALYLADNPTASVSAATAAVLNGSTPNKVTSPGTGSPNRLLYSLFSGSTTPDTTAPSNPASAAATAASSSQINLSWTASTDTGGSGLAGYKVERCSGAGCTAFAEVGTATSNSFSSTGLAASTSYSFRVRAYDGAGNNSGYSNTATATTPAATGTVLSNGVAVTGLAAAAGNSLNYTMVVPAGATNLTFNTSGGTGDSDMYVKFGSAPTDTVYDCRPYASGNTEACTFATPSAGTYYVRLKAYSAFSGLSLVGSYTTGGGGGGTQTYTNTNDVTIGDNTTVNSPIVVSGRSGNAPSNASVTVAIVHTYQGDLKVDLVAPDGTLYNIHNRTGGGTDNVNKTVTLNLSSEALNGTWNLRVNDNAAGDTGYINSWSVTF